MCQKCSAGKQRGKNECSAADRKPADLTCVSVSIYMSVLNILSNAWFVSFCFTPTGNGGQIELARFTQQAQQVKKKKKKNLSVSV